MRDRSPAASALHTSECKFVRRVLKPAAAAHPSSSSIVGASKVSDCHCSIQFTAVRGR